jgi:hypothetical protein
MEADIKLLPGQWVERKAPKPASTRESRIIKAIHSGKKLAQAAEEAMKPGELGFADQHIEALIGLLKTEIDNRTKIIKALETRQIARRTAMG